MQKTTQNIIEKLQLLDKPDLLTSKSKFVSIFSEKKVQKVFFDNNLQAVFCINDKPFVLFFENVVNEQELHQVIWNYNKAVIIIITSNNKTTIFNAFARNNSTKLLEILEDNNETFLSVTNYFTLITGQTFEQYQAKLSYKNRVDYFLLQNIKNVRKKLIEILIKDKNIQQSVKSSKTEKTKISIDNIASQIANSLIGRILFIRYLIDRKVKLHFSTKHKVYTDYLTHETLLQILEDKETTYELFKHLKNKFNGDLFPFEIVEQRENGDVETTEIILNEINIITNEHLGLLIDLLNGNDIGKNQFALPFNVYDFSIIPIEFISNIYELFLGSDKQEESGAYYTPLFLVEYIINNTLGKSLIDKTNLNYKILDPACGSGIFLVQALNKLIEHYKKTENIDDEEIDVKKRKKYKQDLCNLLTDNIFGIDKDKNAISVATFSLYITLLNYQTPADIEDFTFPKIHNNLFALDFFDVKRKDYNKITQQKFAFILGNPPWGEVSESETLFKKYISNRKESENSEILQISDNQIAQPFMLRVSDFAHSDTQIALAITSKILYNISEPAKNFRKYFVNKFFIDEILELSSVRREVFERSNGDAISPCAVIFYRYAGTQNTKENKVWYISLKPNLFFSLFKLLVIERYDCKEIEQGQFENDWLFKLLVYGNILDFQLIRKLKRSENIAGIQEKNNLFIGSGAKTFAGKDDASFLNEKLYIDTKAKKMLQPFIVQDKQAVKKNFGLIDRARLEYPQTFIAPYVLVKLGLNKKLNLVSAFSEKDYSFTNSISVIKGEKQDINLLRNITGILNSSLIGYYILQTGSYAGIERGTTNQDDLKKYPFASSADLVKLVEEIEKIKKDNYDKSYNLGTQDAVAEGILYKKINNLVLDLFKLSNLEKSLLDYAAKISIPLLQDKKNALNYRHSNSPIRPLIYRDDTLKTYAEIFISEFKPRFTQNFGVRIYYSKYAIAMRFYCTSEPLIEPILWEEKETNTILFNLFKNFSFKNVTQQFYIQKDIRGIDNDGSFYIVKPNEYKVWHAALAYYDAFEFSSELTALKKEKL